MRKKPVWIFSCIDNGGYHQAFKVLATSKPAAIEAGFMRARKKAKGDIFSWECKLSFVP